jgi:hypothetical protein
MTNSSFHITLEGQINGQQAAPLTLNESSFFLV